MSVADDVTKLRALTDAQMDEGVATFLLEISGGSVQAAAAQWREQQGYGQAPTPAAAPPPPPTTSLRRTSTAATGMTDSSSNSNTTTGGRRRTKASIVGNIMMEAAVSREPAMNSGPAVEPGGIIRGRDRGFAKNRELLDESAFCEPKMFTDHHLLNSSLNASMNGSFSNSFNNINNNSASNNMDAYGFSTPGAYNETEEGDGFVARERRESALRANPVSALLGAGGAAAGEATARRRVSELGYPSEPMADTSLRRTATDQRRPNPPQPYHRSQPPAYLQTQQQQRQESWTGRNIYAQPPGQRTSMMSVYSDISMGESWMGSTSVEDPDFIPPDEDEMGGSFRSTSSGHNAEHTRRRASEINYASEPMVQHNFPRRANTAELGGSRRRGLRSGGDSASNLSPKPRHRMSTSSTLTSSFSNLGSSNNSQSLLGGRLRDGGDYDSDEYMDLVMETPDLQRKITGSSNRKYSPDSSPPRGESDDAYHNDVSGSTLGSSSRRKRLSATSTLTSNSAHRSSMTRVEATIPEEMGNSDKSNASNLKPDPPGDTIDTPWLHSPRHNPVPQRERSHSPPPPFPDSKPAARKRSVSPRRARRTAAVLVNSTTSEPESQDSQLDTSQNSNYQQSGKERSRTRATQPGVVRVAAEETSHEPNAKVRRAPATQPGVVNVSNKTAAEPTMLQSSSKAATQSSRSEPDAKVRRAPASQPGVVSVSNSTEEPSSDVKVRRVPATRPGVVSVSKSTQEPNSKSSSSQPATSEPDAKVRRAPAIRPGAVSVSDTTPDEPSVSGSISAASGGDVKVRRSPASRPGAVSVSNSAPDEPSVSGTISPASGGDVKVRRAPASRPGAVSVAPDEPSVSGTTSAASEGDAKVRRAPATIPGAVPVSNTSPEEPSLPGLSEPSARQSAVPGPNVKVRRAPASKPGAVSVSTNSAPEEPSVSGASEPSVSGASEPAVSSVVRDGKLRRAPAKTPGAVSVAPEEPDDESAAPMDASQYSNEPQPHPDTIGFPTARRGRPGLRSSQRMSLGATNLVDDALKEENEKEKPRKGLKFFADKPGAIRMGAPDDDSGNAGVTVSAETNKRDQKEKEKHGLGLRKATTPGVVSLGFSEDDSNQGVVKVTSSADSDMQDKKEKEKQGLGRKKATTPGVVHVTGADKAVDEKDSKAGKSLKLFGTSRPGAVSVKSTDEETSKKKQGLRSKASSLTSSEAGENLDDGSEGRHGDDPIMDDSSLMQEDISSRSHPHVPARNRRSPTNAAISASEPGERIRSRSPARMVDPPMGFPKMSPPIKDRKASDKGKKGKSLFGGLFKSKKGKKQNATKAKELEEFEEEKLARMGTSRGFPVPTREHR